MTSYLERYQRGDREQVWLELYSLGDAIQAEPLFSDALAVTRETMSRVRRNIVELIKRLNALNYSFGIYPDRKSKISGYNGPLSPPKPNISKKIMKYEELPGIHSIPLSLKVFWEVVGEVDFSGHYPKMPRFADPLIVFPIEAIDSAHDQWQFAIQAGDVDAGSFLVPLAPDCFHKDNVSGGEPYGIFVPNNGIDGSFANERHQTTFVNYLRLCFQYGGFPGLHWTNDPIPNEIFTLADGLLPI